MSKESESPGEADAVKGQAVEGQQENNSLPPTTNLNTSVGFRIRRTIASGLGARAEHILRSLAGIGLPRIKPEIDMQESEKHYHIVAELPGLEPSDIDLTLAGNVLTIDSQKRREDAVKDQQHLVNELRTGEIHRTITLPGLVGSAMAKHKNGVLKIALEKEAAPARKIKVSGT